MRHYPKHVEIRIHPLDCLVSGVAAHSQSGVGFHIRGIKLAASAPAFAQKLQVLARVVP